MNHGKIRSAVLFASVGLLLALATASEQAAGQTSGDPDPSSKLSNRLFWALRIAQAKPNPTDTLYVLMHSSKDCPYCTRWKRDPAGLGNAKKIADAYPHVWILILDRETLKTPERKTHYPRELWWEYERRLAANELTPGVPVFEIFLQGKAVLRAGGLDAWTERVIPAITTIEGRREPDGAPSGEAPAAGK